MALIASHKLVTSQPSLVVASLDKMLHDDYLCLVESGKQQMKKVTRKFKWKTWKQRQLLSESGFVLRTAPPSLSRDRRIKMKKSIKNITPGVEVKRIAISAGRLKFDSLAGQINRRRFFRAELPRRRRRASLQVSTTSSVMKNYLLKRWFFPRLKNF